MPRIDVGTSIDSIKDEGRKLLPPGQYEVIVKTAELQDNKAKDGKLVYLEYEVTEPTEHAGAKVIDRVSLKEKALWNLKRFLTAAEVPFEGSSFDTEDILGSTLTIQIASSVYNGKPSFEVADYIVK